MSFQTSIPHKPWQVRWCEVHLQWSLSGHQHVCISYFQEDIKQATKKTLKWKKFPSWLIFVLQNPIQVLNLHVFF